MSEHCESFKAVTFDDLVSMLGIESMGYQKYEVVKHLISESLRPYRLRGGIGHSSRRCEAEPISKSLLGGMSLKYYNEKGQSLDYTQRYYLDSCRFSFSGVEIKTEEMVFKSDDVSALFESTGLMGVGNLRKDKGESQNSSRKMGIDGTSTPSKTAAADRGRDMKTADRWAGYLSTAVKMTSEIMTDEPKPYTKAQLAKLAEKHGGDWKEESKQMKTLRDALPDEYISGPGAPKQ